MIAVDTNLLVYAHREDIEWHAAADRCLAELFESGRAWCIPWACVHEFLSVVTHPRIFDPPTPMDQAQRQVASWLRSPQLRMIAETARHLEVLGEILDAGKIRGPAVHDARIAAVCLEHGVEVLWTADRDFSRFAELRTENPLL